MRHSLCVPRLSIPATTYLPATMFLPATICLLVWLLAAAADGQLPSESTARLPTIETKTKGCVPAEGFFKFHADPEVGTVWLEISRWDQDFLIVDGLSAGLGSNPVGLDRGQWGRGRVVRFTRVGRRVFLMERNLRFRASGGDAAERRAVSDSFAESVLWAADLVAQTGQRGLVDAKSLLIRDAYGVVKQLKQAGQGTYGLDEGRSFVNLARCKSFPQNIELEATLTFVAADPGSLAEEAAADGSAISLRLHHSLVALPDSDYRSRASDPRVGSLAITFADYAVPLDAPIEQRLIVRHRLQKSEPRLPKSRPVKPITYYLDPGTPQPVQDALLAGARWWNVAFEDAGFIDAFRVELLPADADPMDIRYNVIQWVHRSTRGWSYGQSIVDPRTGEIIKGHVILGSLRVRQDRLIVDGLTAAGRHENGAVCSCCGLSGDDPQSPLAMFDPAITPIDVSLARLRQLSAHEVGHTLGFSHNFAGSTYADRASVMDYPAPRVKIREGDTFDLSDAYGQGIGVWDRFIVRYAYTEFLNPEAEATGLRRLIDEANERQLVYLSDADARPAGAAHPQANLWDNGSDSVAELRHVMDVRRIALQRLAAKDPASDRPLADFEVALVPIYLFHRYQVAATAKMIGGFSYSYAVGDEAGAAITPVPAAEQRFALDAVLATVAPEQLMISERLLALLPPKPQAGLQDRERFPKRTAMIFDPHAAARVAAELSLSELFQAERAARLAAYPQGDWNLQAMFAEVVSAVWKQPVPAEQHLAALQEIVQRVMIERLVALAENSETSDGVRGVALGELKRLRALIRGRMNSLRSLPGEDHLGASLDEIERFLNRPHESARPPARIVVPPGSPIGS